MKPLREIKFSRKQFNKFKEHTKLKSKKFKRKEIIVKQTPIKKFKRKISKFKRKVKLVRIHKLKPGNLFLMPFSKLTGKLIYANDCRAHVQLDQQIDPNDPNNYKNMPHATDISTNTMVQKIGEGNGITARKPKRHKKHRMELSPKDRIRCRRFNKRRVLRSRKATR